MDHEKGILRGSAFVITESVGFSENQPKKKIVDASTILRYTFIHSEKRETSDEG